MDIRSYPWHNNPDLMHLVLKAFLVFEKNAKKGYRKCVEEWLKG